MAREEEIKKASDELFKSFHCSKTYRMGFEAGVKWADKHPKLPWINIKDDLPCNHEELIENENYTKKSISSFSMER